MANAISQTDPNKTGASDATIVISGATNDILGTRGIGKTTVSMGTGGTPNGELTSTGGSRHYDFTNSMWYFCTAVEGTPSTAWTAFA